jgi:hypothetical protein
MRVVLTRLLHGLCTLSLLCAGLMLQPLAWAQTAPAWLPKDTAGCNGFLDKKISFADGGSACLKDVYEAAFRGDRENILQKLESSGNPYVVAASTNPRSCPLSYRTYWSVGMDARERNRKQALDGCQRALDAAATRMNATATTCSCAVFIENGESSLKRAEFDRLMSDYARQAQAGGRPLAALDARPAAAATSSATSATPSAATAPAALPMPVTSSVTAAPAAQPQRPAPSSMPSVPMAPRKALLIGNDAYAHVKRLDTARADASALARVLGELGYKVTLRLDLDERGMKAALRQFRSEVDGGDEALFFFAGHGVQIGGTNYLLPTDIRQESEDQVRDDGIALQRVLDDLADRRVRLTVAMVDACRDNPFPKVAGRSMGGRGLAPTTAATGQMVIFSAGAGQQALDRLNAQDRDPNGLFTRTLLKEIRTPGVRIDNVIREVRKKVVETARTVGHEQVPAIYDQVVGDFYFVR